MRRALEVNDRQVTIKIPKRMFDVLERDALDNERSLNQTIRLILRKHLEAQGD